jgi:hypothetical protein
VKYQGKGNAHPFQGGAFVVITAAIVKEDAQDVGNLPVVPHIHFENQRTNVGILHKAVPKVQDEFAEKEGAKPNDGIPLMIRCKQRNDGGKQGNPTQNELQ